MSIDRLARVNELLRREIGGALYHVLKDYEVDLAAVTITHVITTRNLRSARVLVSIRDHRGERDRIISRLRRHRAEIQAIINRNMTLKYTPKLMFALDPSVEKGDHILDILQKMEGDTEVQSENYDVLPDMDDSPGRLGEEG